MVTATSSPGGALLTFPDDAHRPSVLARLMSMRSAQYGPMRVMRQERNGFAALGLLLLLVQLLVGGMAQGAMAAQGAGPGAIICTEQGKAGHSSSGSGGMVDCPCLAAACCHAVIAGDARIPLAAHPVFRDTASVDLPSSPVATDRRPLALFARAGQSPPTIS